MIEWLKSDAAYWTLGALPGVLGLLLFLRGIIGWRTRGRPTCWRCRYDMTGASSLTCPECGKLHRNPKHLVNTRRLWKRATLGFLLVSLCAYLLGYPEIHYRRQSLREPWYVAAIPTTAGIAFLPMLKEEQVDWLNSRVTDGAASTSSIRLLIQNLASSYSSAMIDVNRLNWRNRLSFTCEWKWQRSFLAWRCRGLVAEDMLRTANSAPHMWFAVHWVTATGPDSAGITSVLSALQATDETIRLLAIHAIADMNVRDDRIVPALFDALERTRAGTKNEEGILLFALAKQRPVTPRVVNELMAVFDRNQTALEDWNRKAMVAAGDAMLPAVLRALDQIVEILALSASEGRDEPIAGQLRTLHWVIFRIGRPAVDSLVDRLNSPTPWLRRMATSLLEQMGADARDALPRLQRMLKHAQQSRSLPRILKETREPAMREDEIAELIKAIEGSITAE